MTKLLKRFAVFLFVLVAAAIAWDYAYGWLELQRHPQRQLAMQYLERRLGTMTPEQRRIAESAVAVDPLAAMLATQDGWDGVTAVGNHQFSTNLKVESLALDQLFRGNINQPTASGFANSASSLIPPLQADTAYGHNPLDDLRHLSPEEYGNFVHDDTYLVIAPRLDAQYRADFQRHQAALTPLLSVAEPKDWNRLMAAFQASKPRIEQIFAVPVHGRSYGYVYMLNSEAVRDLERTGIEEQDAIRFLGINGSLVREASKNDPNWAIRVKSLKSAKGPDGRSLFQYALEDPSVFGLIAHDPSPDRKDAETVLKHYAGTSIPAILTKYTQSPELFQATIDGLVRFGCNGGDGPSHPGYAAWFINYYQDNPVFKETLAKQGATLIPALSVAGQDWLQKFHDNPKDIDTYVDANGKPVDKPWWTWVPGGNIAYVAKKAATGHTTTTGDWGWAVFDATIIFCPFPVGDTVGNVLGNGFVKVGEKEMVEESVDVGAKTLTRLGVDEAGKVATESIPYAERLAAETAIRAEAGGLLKAAGWAIAKTTMWAIENPVKTGVAIVGVGFGAKYLSMTKAQRESLWSLLPDPKGSLAGIPGRAIESIWDVTKDEAARHPMLAWVFYTLAATLTLFVVFLPLLVLRLLLPEVYRLLMAMVRGVTQTATWPLLQGWRALFGRQTSDHHVGAMGGKQ